MYSKWKVVFSEVFIQIMSNSRPNFLFLGPDKTGSTWMYHLLRSHGEVYVPKIKDIYFFDRNYEKGLNWYLDWFRGANGIEKAVGELSHDYIHSREALIRIKKDLGNIKTIVCFRNHIDRSVSHYLYLLHSGLVSGANIKEELLENQQVRENSLYGNKLVYWRELFPDGLLLNFKLLKDDSLEFGNKILEYVGIDPVKSVPKPQRASSIPRSIAMARVIKLGGVSLRKIGFLRILGILKEANIRNLAFKNTDSTLKQQVEQTVRELWEDEFQEDMEQVISITGRNKNEF